jgi:hypothetical protein
MENLYGYNIEEVVKYFIIAGLWASTDDNDNSLDDEYTQENVSEDNKNDIKKGIIKFIEANKEILARQEIPTEVLGHNLFLNSQGHGVGFWDRGFGVDGETLSDSSEEHFPSDPPYVTDDGDIHFNVK